jgi:superfamily II DNA/RNA helicase
MIKQEKINLKNLKSLVLDEGDELLKLGFRDQIGEIVVELDENVQVCLFSATLPRNVLEIAQNIMVNPSFVILAENKVMTDVVSQWYVDCTNRDTKNGCIYQAIDENKDETIIIFFNTCTALINVAKFLSDQKKTFLQIHSHMEQADRTKSFNDFRCGKSRILLASDMAARGLDIPAVTLVINYDTPTSIETYVHRIGRAGRGDKLGNSITLILSETDRQMIKCIVEVHGHSIRALKNIRLPSRPKF